MAPQLEGSHLTEFAYLEDLNGRRMHDARVIAGAGANGDPKVPLEIGTSHGRTKAIMGMLFRRER